MIVHAWRIVKAKHRATAFSGEGARRFGGRWNSKGVALVYASGSPSLAVLEVFVHLQSHEVLRSYVLIEAEFESNLVEDVSQVEMPAIWRNDPAPRKLQNLGDDWITRGSSAVLRVPSALIDSESNYLLNPIHPEFKKITLKSAKPFRFDSRLLKR